MRDQTWRERAACLGTDPDLYEPCGKGRPSVAAFRVCIGCPVRGSCLTDALSRDSGEDHGVWGGTTARARQYVRSGRWTRGRAMDAGDRIARRSAEAA